LNAEVIIIIRNSINNYALTKTEFLGKADSWLISDSESKEMIIRKFYAFEKSYSSSRFIAYCSIASSRSLSSNSE